MYTHHGTRIEHIGRYTPGYPTQGGYLPIYTPGYTHPGRLPAHTPGYTHPGRLCYPIHPGYTTMEGYATLCTPWVYHHGERLHYVHPGYTHHGRGPTRRVLSYSPMLARHNEARLIVRSPMLERHNEARLRTILPKKQGVTRRKELPVLPEINVRMMRKVVLLSSQSLGETGSNEAQRAPCSPR